MTSKQMKRSTADQLKAAEELHTTRSSHESALLDKLPMSPKERAGAQAFHDYVFNQLTQGAAVLKTKDLAVGTERYDDDPARDDRDQATASLYTIVTRARSTLEGALSGNAARYGMEGDTPKTPDALYKFASRALEMMEQNPGVFTDVFGTEVKTANLVPTLKPAVAALKAAIGKTSAESRELNAALLERDAEADRLARHTRAAALMQEALFLLADEEALWDKSRK
jgi:hypothetical protein